VNYTIRYGHGHDCISTGTWQANQVGKSKNGKQKAHAAAAEEEKCTLNLLSILGISTTKSQKLWGAFYSYHADKLLNIHIHIPVHTSVFMTIINTTLSTFFYFKKLAFLSVISLQLLVHRRPTLV